MAIQLISEITPKNSGSFALLDDKYLRGGLRIVETFDELSLIPTDRLKDGCLVMVTTPSRVLYVYDQANDAWSPFSSGGGGGGSDWLCVEDGETTRLVKDVENWTQKIVVINHIRTYDDYFALPTEYVQNNEVAYCKSDSSAGTTIYKKGLYSYDAEKASWLEVNSTIEIDSALSDTSKRPVQNRVVTKALEEKVSKDDVDNVISRFSENPIQNKAVATALENMKNSKTMTAEEYDALDDETKNDGSFYYISDTGEIYQNGIIYGGKQIFDVTQEEYDALTDEEKADNEYHCTDTGRVYINGILYGDKKPIELTFEEYKQLEADDLVEADVDYVIVSDEKGILLASEDVGYKDKTVHEALVTLEEDVLTAKDEIANKSLPNIYSVTTDFDYITHYCLKDVLKVSNDRELTLLLLTRGGEEMRIVIGKDNTTYKINAYKTVENYNKILKVYSYNDTDLYITLATYSNFLKVYLMSGEISDTFSGQNVGRTLPDGVVEIPIIKNALASDITSTYLIKDIAAGGENEKTVSFKIYKGYFSAYYAKRTFLLSANVYSLGFSKPVIGLVEIFRSSADNYGGYVVNLQDTRYTGVTVTVNGDYLEVVVTFNSYESSGCMVSCSSLSNVPIA